MIAFVKEAETLIERGQQDRLRGEEGGSPPKTPQKPTQKTPKDPLKKNPKDPLLTPPTIPLKTPPKTLPDSLKKPLKDPP